MSNVEGFERGNLTMSAKKPLLRHPLFDIGYSIFILGFCYPVKTIANRKSKIENGQVA